MNYPKISIVTACYNSSKYIEETILSVISQSYPSLQYIIIDGGSTDNTTEIIKKYENYLSFCKSEKDNGLYHALQKGFLKADGDIMTYLNSDDILTKGSLFTVAQIFSDYPDVQWITGIINHIDEQGRSVYIEPQKSWNKYKFLHDYRFIQQEGTFWRRALWKNAGGYISTSYRLASDLELWCRFFNYAQLYSICAITGSYRARSKDQLSVEYIGQYHDEASAIIIENTKTKLDRLFLFSLNNRFLSKLLRINLFSHVNFIKKLRIKIYYYPPIILFDRYKQKFILNEK